MSDYKEATPTRANIPIACKLTGTELEARGDEVNDIFAQAMQIEELADGYAFTYPADEEQASKLLSFILTERSCCPFFTFELVFEENNGPVQLRLRGGEGVRDFIKSGLLDSLPG